MIKFSVLVSLVLVGGSAMGEDRVFSKVKPSEVPAGLVYNTVQPPVEDSAIFKGKKVAILASHGVQESELTFPYEFLKARGAAIDIVVPSWSEGRALLVQYVKPTMWVRADESFKSALLKDYDLIMLTGGAWNSTVVRGDEDALSLIRRHNGLGKPIAAICSAAQVLISAGLVQDRNVTGTSSLKVDIKNAGGFYLDQSVVVDGNLITSRSPEDLPDFVSAIGVALE